MIELKQADACGKVNPLSLLPMVASSSPERGSFICANRQM
jgi:hypothetical protein